MKTSYIPIIDADILHISQVHAIFMLLRAKLPFIVGVTLQFTQKYSTNSVGLYDINEKFFLWWDPISRKHFFIFIFIIISLGMSNNKIKKTFTLIVVFFENDLKVYFCIIISSRLLFYLEVSHFFISVSWMNVYYCLLLGLSYLNCFECIRCQIYCINGSSCDPTFLPSCFHLFSLVHFCCHTRSRHPFLPCNLENECQSCV